MMDFEDKQLLEKLQAEVKCPRNFACVFLAVDELCEGKYHADRDIVECKECRPGCSFCTATSSMKVCMCPLRKFIAKNFDKWTAASTAQLRLAMAQQREAPGD